MILTENELFAQFVLLSGSKIYFFWQKYTSQTKCFFGSLSNWSLWAINKSIVNVISWYYIDAGTRAGPWRRCGRYGRTSGPLWSCHTTCDTRASGGLAGRGPLDTDRVNNDRRFTDYSPSLSPHHRYGALHCHTCTHVGDKRQYLDRTNHSM